MISEILNVICLGFGLVSLGMWLMRLEDLDAEKRRAADLEREVALLRALHACSCLTCSLHRRPVAKPRFKVHHGGKEFRQ